MCLVPLSLAPPGVYACGTPTSISEQKGVKTIKRASRFLLFTFLSIGAFSGGTFPVFGDELPPLQPLARNVRQIESALSYLGAPLSDGDQRQIDDAMAGTDDAAAVRAIEATLDKHSLVTVEINAESRVTVVAGEARPELMESGTRIFLVK